MNQKLGKKIIQFNSSLLSPSIFFESGRHANIGNTKDMSCQTVFLRFVKHSKRVFKDRNYGNSQCQGEVIFYKYTNTIYFIYKYNMFKL